MKGKYVIGIDYGTDSCRAVIVDSLSGEEIAIAEHRYPRWGKGLYCDPAANRYRQHPLDYTESLEKVIIQACRKAGPEITGNISGISFDTTGSTPALIDINGTPLAMLPEFAENPNAMFVLWKDHTAVDEAEEINTLAKKFHTDYTAYEGGTYSSEWVWAKVLHILRVDPAIRKAAYSWTEHCDWMPALLTGKTKPESMFRSRCAAGHKAMWSEKWGGLPSQEFLTSLDPLLAGMRERLFKDTYTGNTAVGTLTPEWAEKLGLPERVIVSVGAIDAHVGAVGSGAEPYVLTRVIGTSTCDIMTVDENSLGGRCVAGICGQVDGSVLPGYTGLEAGQSAFGDIYAWFRDILAWPLRALMPDSDLIEKTIELTIPSIMEEAAKTEPSADGIVALDWMNGRRTPYADQTVKGAISGLTLGSTAPMIFRALVEATAFGSKAIIEHLQSQGVEIKYINATGGITHKSPFVMQTLADVLDMPIRVVRSTQTCALGAAMFASVAAGIHPDVETAIKHMASGFSAEYVPDAGRHEIYMELYTKYTQLAKLQQEHTSHQQQSKY